MTTYAAHGDIANLAVLALSLMYSACVIYFGQDGKTGLLDEIWKQDGFCIQNKTIPYWSSFDTCLYVDTLFCIIIMGLYFRWKQLPGMQKSSELVPIVALGTLGHGLAHGVLAMKFREEDSDSQQEENNAAREASWLHLIGFMALFWFPLLKASMFQVSNLYVFLLAILATYGNVNLPDDKYGFMYVQTVLSIGMHISQLALPNKEKECREYMTMPLLAALPTVLTAWNEAVLCSAYFQSLGGHVLYDASICVGFLMYYIDAYLYHQSSGGKGEATKAKQL